MPAPPAVPETERPAAAPTPAEADPSAATGSTVATQDEVAEVESAWDEGSALAGELTLAEAYLQALESGDPSEWEGSGP
jgi:hypothetical protein